MRFEGANVSEAKEDMCAWGPCRLGWNRDAYELSFKRDACSMPEESIRNYHHKKSRTDTKAKKGDGGVHISAGGNSVPPEGCVVRGAYFVSMCRKPCLYKKPRNTGKRLVKTQNKTPRVTH